MGWLCGRLLPYESSGKIILVTFGKIKNIVFKKYSLYKLILTIMKRNSILSLTFILLIHLSLDAQYRNQSSLTLEKIMQGENFVGFLPENIQWYPDSRQIHFSWKPNETDTLRSQYKVIIEDPSPVKISEEELLEMPAIGQWNKDRTMMVYAKNGDIYLFSDIDQTIRQITRTSATEYNPQFSQKGDKIYFRIENNLFSIPFA